MGIRGMIIETTRCESPGRPDQRSATAWCSAVGGSRVFFPTEFFKGDLRKTFTKDIGHLLSMKLFFEFSTILLREIMIQSGLCNSEIGWKYYGT